MSRTRIRAAVLVLFYASSAMAEAATDTAAVGTPAELANIESLSADTPPTTTVDSDTKNALSGGLRLNSIREEATRVGMQGGLAWRYAQIESSLTVQQEHLSQIYDFSRVMVNDFVLPPVITVVNDGLRQIDENTIRETKVGYRIEYPARIVTTPPQWNDFLIKHFQRPEPPLEAVLPRTDREREIWKSAADEGWIKGIAQANLIFDSSLALLTRTYRGMLNFHILEREGVVTRPLTASADLGIVVNGREMNVGDTIYRITGQSKFSAPDGWKPLLQATDKIKP